LSAALLALAVKNGAHGACGNCMGLDEHAKHMFDRKRLGYGNTTLNEGRAGSSMILSCFNSLHAFDSIRGGGG
jgi:hypothetical protein